MLPRLKKKKNKKIFIYFICEDLDMSGHACRKKNNNTTF